MRRPHHTPRRSRCAAIFLALAATSFAGCATPLDRALQDHRGTEVWNKSSDAFKEIMRRYVHGDDHVYTDAELDEQFHAYLTLNEDDVDDFIRQQSCVPPTGSGPARYYTVNATHQRHDAFYEEAPARPLAGEGSGKTLKAAFTANMLLERHEISEGTTFPKRANKAGNPFTEWKALTSILSERDRFDDVFRFRDPAQADEVFGATSAVDWSSASGELYIAPPLTDGHVFSPALFGVFMLRATTEAPFSMYLTVSANASGAPEVSYVGLIRPGTQRHQEAFFSDTRFRFTVLSDKSNLLNYELVLTGENPTSFELWLTTAFPEHPNKPYLTVRSVVSPTVSENALESFNKVKAASLIMMLRKGTLMRDLVAAYYPDAKELELWSEVGAIKSDPDFKHDMEAAGLTVGADLFESGLWLQKPTIVDGDDQSTPGFEVLPGMDLRCETSP